MEGEGEGRFSGSGSGSALPVDGPLSVLFDDVLVLPADGHVGCHLLLLQFPEMFFLCGLIIALLSWDGGLILC